LLPQLEPRAEELAAVAVEKLKLRGTREEKDLRETLERHRDHVREELAKHEGAFQQLTFEFGDEGEAPARIRHALLAQSPSAV
jgi:hypothetical protein